MILVLVIYINPGNKCIITAKMLRRQMLGVEDELRWSCDGRGHRAELTGL